MTEQRTLPFAEPTELMPAPRARHDDPGTSKTAARRAWALQAQHTSQILDALRGADRALTCDEIAERAGLTGVRVARRMAELLACNLAVVDGRGLSSAGRPAQRYRAGSATP